MSQRKQVLERLQRGWTSPLDALRDCGSMKLATRVGELRRAGHVIEDQWHKSKKYKIYRFVKTSK